MFCKEGATVVCLIKGVNGIDFSLFTSFKVSLLVGGLGFEERVGFAFSVATWVDLLGEGLGSEGVGGKLRKAYGSKGPF